MRTTRRTIQLITLTFALIATLTAIRPARATTNVVTNLADSGPGSLRYVIANAFPGDKVVFSVTGMITLTTGAINIANNGMIINGPGANLLIVSGGNTSRIFNISEPMTINGLTLTNGLSTGTGLTGAAGAILYSPVLPSSVLTLNNMAFTSNQAQATVSWGGGAIYNYNGTIQLTNCAFSGNIATLNGGAIYNDGALSITNCTLTANTATQRAGGAIYNSSGTVTIKHSTITSNNAANGAGGGIFNYPYGRIRLSNSILAGNSSPIGTNYAGNIDSRGYNLIQDRTGSSGYVVSDLPNLTNPNLGSYGLNGGQTSVQVPNVGSPAINVIPSTGGCNQSVIVDQRGASRPQGATCDIGAVETGVTPTTPAAKRKDTPGFYRPSLTSGQGSFFYLRTSLSSGSTDLNTQFGPQDGTVRKPVMGDWNGDGVDTLGIYGSFAGQDQFILINNNAGGSPDFIFPITGSAAGDQPISGRWDNTMTADGVGLYRVSNGMVYLKKTLATGAPNYSLALPSIGCGFSVSILVGDWDGNVIDGVSQRCDTSAVYYLSHETTGVAIPAPFNSISFAAGTDIPFGGDWLGLGVSSIGAYRPSTQTFYLRLYTDADASTLAVSVTPTGGVQAGDVPVVARTGAPGAVPPPMEENHPPFWIIVPGGNSGSSDTPGSGD